MSATETHVNEPAECRALAVVEAPAPREKMRHTSRAAPFLAQLIATRAQLPQTRTHRRADPAEAVACYRAVAGMMKSRAA